MAYGAIPESFAALNAEAPAALRRREMLVDISEKQ
jgi:hypothetical protein